MALKDEYKKQFEALGRILWVVVFALLYGLGGIEYKFLRRFLAPLWLGGGLYLFSRDWRKCSQAFFLMGALHLGYGADAVLEKIARRAIFGAAAGITPLWMFFQKGAWRVWLFNVALCVGAYIVFGVWNPFPSARIEEMTLGFLVGFLSLMSAKKEGNMKIVTWILANGATLLGLIQAIIKAVKELLTGIVNLLSLFMPQEKADAAVTFVRNLVNKADDAMEWVKEKLLNK